MSKLSSQPVSELLAEWQAGDKEAFRALVPLVYKELRRLAHRYLQRGAPRSHAAEHRAGARGLPALARQEPARFENRAHFFAISARLMRHILVEYARRRRAAKRDAGYKVTLDRAESLLKEQTVDLMALDDALNGVARLDPQQSRIVELRFFGGLEHRRDGAGIEDIAGHRQARLGHRQSLAASSDEHPCKAAVSR